MLKYAMVAGILLSSSLIAGNEDLKQFVQLSTDTLASAPMDEPYETLLISNDEKQKIAKILITMADNNVFQLLFEKKYLERLGQEVHHVHPVRFLGTVFNDPHLVNCMHMIRSSGFKWGGFMDGFSERLKGEMRAGNVNHFIPGLAKKLNLRAADIQAYINIRDIEGLVLFLMEQKKR